jgi:hypothetical protein
MNKKYQVFVSSTYLDLIEERQAVIKALLNVDCIPSGMELFPATDTSQWEYIKRVIKECDYYILLIAGRYGSVEKESGLSYTEKEYRYAREIGKPTICFYLTDNFLESLPAEKKERELEGQVSLKNFKSLARENLSAPFTNPDNLAFNVVNSINNLKMSTPTVGWIRGDSVIAGDSAEEILKLRNENDNLKINLLNKSDEKFAKIESFYGNNILFSCLCNVFEENQSIPLVSRKIDLRILFKDFIYFILPYFTDSLDLTQVENKFKEYFNSREMKLDFIEISQKHRIEIDLSRNELVRFLIFLKKCEIIKQDNAYYSLTDFGEEFIANNLIFERVN